MESLNTTLLRSKEKRRPQKHKVQLAGISTIAVMLIAVIVVIVAGRTKTVRASEGQPITITAPDTSAQQNASSTVANALTIQPDQAGRGDSSAMKTPSVFEQREIIPTTFMRNRPVGGASLSKNSDVFLTDQQEEFVEAFAKYLAEQGKIAIVTSGKRTSESQLDIIKERIQELGANKKFPALQRATVSNTKSWLAAWNWLRSKKVPVNAPAAVAGAKSSLHLQGRAIDMIANDLDELKNWLSSFSRSMYAKQTSLRIAGILREPGCIHVSLG